MFDSGVISFVFRLLNFGVLIGLFVYLFKTYGKQAITSQMRKDAEKIKQLQERTDQLHTKKNEIIDAIKKDAEQCSALRDKINKWHIVADDKQAGWQADREQRIEIVRAHVQQRSQKVSEHRIEQHIGPKAVAKARAQLEKQFASEKDGQAYINNVIKQTGQS